MAEYRFIFDPRFQSDCDPFIGDPVSSQEAAEGQMDLVAKYTLHLHKTFLMPCHTNFGFVEKRDIGGVWEEIDEDNL